MKIQDHVLHAKKRRTIFSKGKKEHPESQHQYTERWPTSTLRQRVETRKKTNNALPIKALLSHRAAHPLGLLCARVKNKTTKHSSTTALDPAADMSWGRHPTRNVCTRKIVVATLYHHGTAGRDKVLKNKKTLDTIYVQWQQNVRPCSINSLFPTPID